MKFSALTYHMSFVGRNGNSFLSALLSFGVGITFIGFICLLINQYQRTQIHDAFQRDTTRVTALTETHLHAHFETLLSIKGLFAAGDIINRNQFRRFLDQLELKKNHPGFQAIQFVRYVPEQERERFINAVRHDTSINQEGYSHFNIRPDVRRPQHYVIEYTEPFEGNEAAFGLDLASLPSHLKALELGRDSGNPVATERVKLVQDSTGQAGFVVRIPLYRNDMPLDTIEQRRTALFGFGAIVYRVNDLMKEVIDPQLIPHMRIQILDTGFANAEASRNQTNLMFDSQDAYREAAPTSAELPISSASHTLVIGQRRWELHFVARESSRYGRDYSLIASVAISGSIISALIAILVIALGRRRFLSAQLAAALIEQKAILDNATVGIELIKNRVIQSCNQGMAEMLGYGLGELVGKSTRIKFPSDESFADIEKIAYPTMMAGNSWIGDVEWIRKDGSRICCRLHGKYVDLSNPEKGSIWVSYDITAQKLADAALIEANKELERSLAQVERTHREVTHLSELSGYLQACPSIDDAFSCICEFAPRLFPQSSGAIYLMDADRETLIEKASWGNAALAKHSFLSSECWALRRGQAYRLEQPSRTLCCPHLGTDHDDRLNPYACLPLVAQDTTFGLLFLEHRHTEAETNIDMRYRLAVALAEDIGLALANMQLRDTLRQQSIRDPLTGLFNRRHMNDVVHRELARAERDKTLLAFAIIDVDHFKHFNDTHGHDAGDSVLQAVAAAIEGQVRQSDIVCRFGGEEFVVVLPDIGVASAQERVEEIRTAISRMEIKHGGRTLGQITASLGLAFYPMHGMNENALIKAADDALYQAKETGRNRMVVSKTDQQTVEETAAAKGH